jgi:hypothetical protein
MQKQFYEDLITVHKCTGAHTVYNSGKYIGPILRQRHNLKDDPDFTVKELYRHHNFAESNIGKRKAVKVMDGPPKPPASSANDTTESMHPSSSNTLDVPDHAHVDLGIGSFSESLNWSYAHCAGHHEALDTHSSMLRIASWVMQEVNGVFLQDNAKKTSAISFPRMLFNRHKCMGSYQFMLDFTRPICTRMLELLVFSISREGRRCSPKKCWLMIQLRRRWDEHSDRERRKGVDSLPLEVAPESTRPSRPWPVPQEVLRYPPLPILP